MIEFFRDKLDGPLYVIVALISLFLIVAIIGFIMERIKLQKEENEKVVHIEKTPEQEVSIEPVKIESTNIDLNKQEEVKPVEDELILKEPVVSEEITEEVEENSDINDVYVKPQVIVFEDPDDKKE